MRGDLRQSSLADVVRDLYAERKSGVLHVSRQGIGRRVHFKKGVVVFADAGDDQLQTREQAELLAYSLFTWTSGEFSFEDGEPNIAESLAFEGSPSHVILEGIRRIDELEILERLVGGNDSIFACTQTSVLPLFKMKLSPAENAILTFAREREQFSAADLPLPSGALPVVNALNALVAVGLLEIVNKQTEPEVLPVVEAAPQPQPTPVAPPAAPTPAAVPIEASPPPAPLPPTQPEPAPAAAAAPPAPAPVEQESVTLPPKPAPAPVAPLMPAVPTDMEQLFETLESKRSRITRPAPAAPAAPTPTTTPAAAAPPQPAQPRPTPPPPVAPPVVEAAVAPPEPPVTAAPTPVRAAPPVVEPAPPPQPPPPAGVHTPPTPTPTAAPPPSPVHYAAAPAQPRASLMAVLASWKDAVIALVPEGKPRLIVGAIALVAITVVVVAMFTGGSDETPSQDGVVAADSTSEAAASTPAQPPPTPAPRVRATEPEPEPVPSEAELFYRANLAFESGDFEQSKVELERLLELEPDLEAARQLMARVEVELTPEPKPEPPRTTRPPRPVVAKPPPKPEPKPEPARPAGPTPSQLYVDAHAALNRGELEVSQAKLDALQQVNPSYPGTQQLQEDLAQRFWETTLPLAFSSRHDHALGGCDGVLTLTSRGYGYRSNDHEWFWNFADVDVAQRKDSRRLRIENTKGQSYNFELRDALVTSDWTRFQKLKTRR